MSKKSLFFITIFGTLVGAIGCTQFAIALAFKSSASTLTLNVPRTVNIVDAQTWCQSGDVIGTGRPFGFNKVRFYTDKTNTKGREYLIGCITNNSGETIDFLPISHSAQYPPSASKVNFGFSSYNIPNFKTGQTVFFKSKFQIDSQATGINLEIKRFKQQSQATTDETVQRLIINRR